MFEDILSHDFAELMFEGILFHIFSESGRCFRVLYSLIFQRVVDF